MLLSFLSKDMKEFRMSVCFSVTFPNGENTDFGTSSCQQLPDPIWAKWMTVNALLLSKNLWINVFDMAFPCWKIANKKKIKTEKGVGIARCQYCFLGLAFPLLVIWIEGVRGWEIWMVVHLFLFPLGHWEAPQKLKFPVSVKIRYWWV